MSAFYKLNMEMLEETTLNSKYVAVTVNNGIIKLLSSYAETPTDIDERTESRTLDTGILTPNSSKDYSVSIWMDKNVTLEDDAQNKTFKSKIVVNTEATNIKSKTGELNPNESIKNSLLCSQQNDAFTVNDTTHRNGALTYPAGLLSPDELFLTNVLSISNNTFGPMFKYEQFLMMSYDLEFPDITPVINVKADTLIYGNGTASNPYRPIE